LNYIGNELVIDLSDVLNQLPPLHQEEVKFVGGKADSAGARSAVVVFAAAMMAGVLSAVDGGVTPLAVAHPSNLIPTGTGLNRVS
jgi:hypothetical protein